jgi:hypothetical protein
MIDDQTYRKLTKKEKETIEKIADRAKKRPRKKIYTEKWMRNYLLSVGFLKLWNFDTRADAEDFVDASVKVAMKLGLSQKKAHEHITYVNAEYLDSWFCDD